MAKPKIMLEDFGDMLDFNSKPDTAPAPVQGGITEMDFSQMQSFPNHKFKLYEGQQLTDMVESIRQFGILLPIILWHTDDNRYVILSGHNRRNAAQLAGLTAGPVIIKENLTHAEAVLIVTETNLRQRSFTDMCHSERAYCLAQHYEALMCCSPAWCSPETREISASPCWSWICNPPGSIAPRIFSSGMAASVNLRRKCPAMYANFSTTPTVRMSTAIPPHSQMTSMWTNTSAHRQCGSYWITSIGMSLCRVNPSTLLEM